MRASHPSWSPLPRPERQLELAAQTVQAQLASLEAAVGVVPDEIAASHCVALSRPKELADLLDGYATIAG